MSSSIWEEKNNPELVHNHLWNVNQAIISELRDHYDNIEVYHYSHTGIIEMGAEEQPQAPCIVLTGPRFNRSLHLTTGNIVVDVGTDEIGHVRTRKYDRIKYWDLDYDILFIMPDTFSLFSSLESSSHFYTERGFIRVDGNVYKVVQTDPLSAESIRNYTNSPMASGRFEIRGVMLVDPYSVFHSGRIYYPKYLYKDLEEEND